MVTLLYGIAIGVVITRAYLEVRTIILRRRLKKEQERFRQALDGLGLTIRQFFHGIEYDLEQRRKESVGNLRYWQDQENKDLTIDERILMAIEDQNYELAAKLRDERDKLKEG